MSRFHNLDPDSNEFYKIAQEYSISNNLVYVSMTCDVDISIVRALQRDERFIALSEEIKKSFNGKDPYEIKKESSRLMILAENERIALSRSKTDEKHKMKAIDNALIMNKDLQKGASSKNEVKGTSVKLSIGEEKYDDENGDE